MRGNTQWLLLAAPGYATQPIGCDARLQVVNKELEFARMHNNTSQISGLEKAANEIKINCSDDRLIAEQLQRVSKLQRKVNECELELQEANARGKPDKIAKRQRRLEEANINLSEAQRELDALQRLGGNS